MCTKYAVRSTRCLGKTYELGACLLAENIALATRWALYVLPTGNYTVHRVSFDRDPLEIS